MKKLFGSLLIMGLLSGCIVRTNNRGYRNNGRSGCGPGYYWDGYNCVHNGNRGKTRDHRR